VFFPLLVKRCRPQWVVLAEFAWRIYVEHHHIFIGSWTVNFKVFSRDQLSWADSYIWEGYLCLSILHWT